MRHLELEDLPPAIAERLRFERAAPKRLRSERLPLPIREELEAIWDGIVADIYDEVAGERRRDAFTPQRVREVLGRVADRLLQAERIVIFTAVHHPLRGNSETKHLAVAGLGGGASAAVEELASLGTAGTATTVAIMSAAIGEVFETYVAASVRALQYRRSHWPLDPNAIVLDLAEAAGYGQSAGRRATAVLAHDAVRWLGEALVARTASRFMRGLIPVYGVAVGAGFSGYSVNRVRRLALRPPSGAAVQDLVLELLNDPEAYARERARFLELEPTPDLPKE